MQEAELLDVISSSKRILLFEPGYKRRYPPLGLAKIAGYARKHWVEVDFSRDLTRLKKTRYDLICVSSLFTYDSQRVLDALKTLRKAYRRPPIVCGGVYATLMAEHAQKHSSCEIFRGYSRTLDMQAPDMEIDWQLEQPWDQFSFVFTTRGCPNRCPYCAVWRLESDIWLNPRWQLAIDPGKPYVMVSDNNLSSCSRDHIRHVAEFLVKHKKRAVFDNGFDCKFVDDEFAEIMSKVRYTRAGMRPAFDRIEEDGVFQAAVRRLITHGIPKGEIMAYVLFNFNDTPTQADYRMRECVNLGIRPYPQQFTPLNSLNRDVPYVGKHWTLRLARAFRNFWLMAGLYGKATFAEYAASAAGQGRYRLEPEDWNAWRGQTM